MRKFGLLPIHPSAAAIHNNQKGKEKEMVNFAIRKSGFVMRCLMYAGVISAMAYFASCAPSTQSRFSEKSPMETADTCISIAPYFKVHTGKLDDFKKLCIQLMERSKQEPNCLFYGFTFNGTQAHCREGYADAKAVLARYFLNGPAPPWRPHTQAVLAHLENIGPLLTELLKTADITKLEVHGPEAELAKLREPMAGLNPRFFVLEYGFRK